MIASGLVQRNAKGSLLSACLAVGGSLHSQPAPAYLADMTVGRQAPPNPALPSRSRGTNAGPLGALPQVESAT
jgi:hypothetical protein